MENSTEGGYPRCEAKKKHFFASATLKNRI
jgi:hypothetical protein